MRATPEGSAPDAVSGRRARLGHRHRRLFLAVIAGAVGGITGQEASARTAQPAASSAAASIPKSYLADFKAAGTRYGMRRACSWS